MTKQALKNLFFLTKLHCSGTALNRKNTQYFQYYIHNLQFDFNILLLNHLSMNHFSAKIDFINTTVLDFQLLKLKSS